MVASGADSPAILMWDPKKPKGKVTKIKTKSKAVWALQGAQTHTHHRTRAWH